MIHSFHQSRLTQQPTRSLLHLSDTARAQGIRIQAGSGSGKTLLAALLALQDWQRGKPQLLFDPYGGLIQAFLWRVDCFGRQLSASEREQLFDRIVYVDMSGQVSGHVVPFPLFQRLGKEPPYNVGQRVYNALIRLDPELKSASIQGANAIEHVLIPLVMVLTALGPEWQVGALLDLMAHSSKGRWMQRLDEAEANCPEIHSAANFVRGEFAKWDKGTRQRNLASLQVKLDPFRYSPALSAIYGSSQSGLDLADLIAQGKTVCLDFGGCVNQEQRRFGLVWTLFYWLLPYIRNRGTGYAHPPVGIVVDELSALQADTPLGRELLAGDLNELINILRRQFRLWLTLVHQEAYQLDEKVAQNLMSLGTQILGVSHDYESSLATAKQFFDFAPQVKRWEPVYGSVGGGPQIVDYRPVEHGLPEMQQAGAQLFRQLKQFHFLTRIAQSEGGASGPLKTLNIEPLLGPFIDEQRVEALKQQLSRRDGLPIDQLLKEMTERNRWQAEEAGEERKPSTDNAKPDATKSGSMEKESSEDELHN